MSSELPRLGKGLKKHLDELPVLPTVVASLMSLDSRSEDYFDRVVGLIESDPNFSTRILAAANSAFSGALESVTTLRAAIARVGTRGAANLIMALSVARVFVPRDDWEKSLWRHAIQVAIASRSLASRMNDSDVSPEEAYTCGLLHDIGRFVLFQEAPDQLREVDEGDWSNPEELIATEEAICGLTHAELGAAACTKWGLPEIVMMVVRDHHSPLPEQPEGSAEKLTSLVRAADIAMFASARPGSIKLEEADDATLSGQLLPRLPTFVRMSVQELRVFLRDAVEEADALVDTLGLA